LVTEPSQFAYPASQVKPQTPAVHVVADACGRVGQAVHDAPHESTLLLLTHAPPHRWKPVLHAATPHAPAVQLGVPFGTLQTKPQLPQFKTLLFRFVQAPPQIHENGALQLYEQLTPSQVGVAFAGAVQFVQEPPQCAGSDVGKHAPPHR
jgi:hypothetical protein